MHVCRGHNRPCNKPSQENVMKNRLLPPTFLIAVFLFTVFASIPVSSQEALKSTEEEYYDFLSIQGLAERPTLNYRTLSDSEWKLTGGAAEGNHVWAGNNLGTRFTLWQAANPADNWFTRGIDQGITMKVYGPEWFNSFNTAAPYGQNDGALWQGKGYNTSLTGGIRFEAYGFEATIKPQLSFSQNMSFDIMPSNYDSEYGYFWGYSKNVGVDAPQRFGDKPFFTFDWGDTEIRWSWHTFTVGFGTQSIWLGPAYLNPILHSNNAASYPKFDIGLRKTPVTIPGLGWYIGNIEGRIWTGYLSESDYFDNDDSNNHNMIYGFTLAYAPSFLSGLVLSANKVCLTKFGDDFYKYLNPFYDSNIAEDQKISIGASWLSQSGGIEVYGELGIDDKINLPDNTIESYITHFWHTMVYSVGMKKTLSIYPSKNIYGELIFEWNNTEMSQDMQVQWFYSFGMHHQITQGYTNRGQWLGSGVGYGGNSQYLEFKLYYPKGVSSLFLHRYNPDNNFLFKESIYDVATGETGDLHKRTWNCYKGILSIGVSSIYIVSPNLYLMGSISYQRIVNPLYEQEPRYKTWHNINLIFGIKYVL